MAIRTPLSPGDLAPLLEAHGFAGVRSLQGIEAGTVNTSYSVDLVGGGRVFLRLYEQQGIEGAGEEARMLELLASRGVMTPSPLRRLDGGVVTELHGKACVLFPFLEGRTLPQSSVTEEHTEAVGRALANLHLASSGLSRGTGRFGAAALLPHVRGMATHPSPDVRRLAPELEGRLCAWDSAREPALPRGLVHGDLFRDNVLWHEGRIGALLDFESAHDAPFVFDLAVSLLSWCYGGAFVWPLARAMVSGYDLVRPLGEVERRGLLAEACFACLRFTVTRITDDTIRVGKDYRRFLARLAALEALEAPGGPGLRHVLAL